MAKMGHCPQCLQTIYILFRLMRNIYKIDYMLDSKISFNKFQRFETTQTMFPDHRTIKIEINTKKMAKLPPPLRSQLPKTFFTATLLHGRMRHLLSIYWIPGQAACWAVCRDSFPERGQTYTQLCLSEDALATQALHQSLLDCPIWCIFYPRYQQGTLSQRTHKTPSS